jgi:hypothetical protein
VKVYEVSKTAFTRTNAVRSVRSSYLALGSGLLGPLQSGLPPTAAPRRAYVTFNSVFKDHWNRKAPRSGKAQYKRELMAAKLRHIQLTPWPSQAKGKVSGVGGEEERLLTVLYYDLSHTSKRKKKGEHDDEDDDESD